MAASSNTEPALPAACGCVHVIALAPPPPPRGGGGSRAGGHTPPPPPPPPPHPTKTTFVGEYCTQVNILFVGMVWSSFFALRALGVAMVTVLKNLTNFLVRGRGRVDTRGVPAGEAIRAPIWQGAFFPKQQPSGKQ